jgi:hypothetical protein
MTTKPDQNDLFREAKAIVVLAFRNGPIENVHAGTPCPTCNGKSGYSRVSDDEIKLIMKNAVNRIYSLLRLKADDPDAYAKAARLWRTVHLELGRSGIRSLG